MAEELVVLDAEQAAEETRLDGLAIRLGDMCLEDLRILQGMVSNRMNGDHAEGYLWLAGIVQLAVERREAQAANRANRAN